jgi:phosphoribosylglycinamide formyltransferase
MTRITANLLCGVVTNLRCCSAEVDRGAPILTQPVEIQEGETLEDLEQRIHSYEHELIVKATAIKAEEIVARKLAKT